MFAAQVMYGCVFCGYVVAYFGLYELGRILICYGNRLGRPFFDSSVTKLNVLELSADADCRPVIS